MSARTRGGCGCSARYEPHCLRASLRKVGFTARNTTYQPRKCCTAVTFFNLRNKFGIMTAAKGNRRDMSVKRQVACKRAHTITHTLPGATRAKLKSDCEIRPTFGASCDPFSVPWARPMLPFRQPAAASSSQQQPAAASSSQQQPAAVLGASKFKIKERIRRGNLRGRPFHEHAV